MRVSVIVADPGYRADAIAYVAYLNGVEITEVFTADEEQGYLDRYQTDEQGHVMVNPKGDGLLTERRHGIVRVFHRDDAPKKDN